MCATTRRSLGCKRPQVGDIGGYFASFSRLQADSPHRRQNFGDADEIVCGGSQHEEPLHQAAAAMPGLAQTPNLLHPPERFFDLLALDGADPIAGMAGRARIDRRAAVGVLLRDMLRAAALAATSKSAVS